MRIEDICKKFNISGEYVSCQMIKTGHINKTYKVTYLRDGRDKDYIVQMINKKVFKHPEKVMDNVCRVSEFIRDKVKQTEKTAKRRALHFQSTEKGRLYYVDENKDYWRCYRYIENSICFNETDNLLVLEETGKAFGEFQNLLSDFDAQILNVTIPEFHNTINRYKLLRKAIDEDEVERVKKVTKLIQEYLKLEFIGCSVARLQKSHDLPLRVTHNDTKCNNVLFDENDNKHLAVIDLDTVMPGLAVFDFGDAIRFGASTAKEDESNLKKIRLDIAKFEAFTKGYLHETKNSLTDKEICTLSIGAIDITIECGVRFLTDYINGDKYFKVDYPGQNLDRAKAQLKLAKDMIRKIDLMNRIIYKYAEK